MNIYIPSLGRVSTQTTLLGLPPDVREKVTLVVPPYEYPMYFEMWGDTCLIEKPEVSGIGSVRQWCVEQSPEKVLMLDDDLTFFTRRKDEPTKFQNSTDEDIKTWLHDFESMLDGYAHMSLAPREGANRDTNQYRWNIRMLRVLAYRSELLRDLGIRFDRLPVMEDFDVSLQLLRAGFPSCTLNEWCQNQYGSGTKGGCSTYRTLEVQAQGANGLYRNHPDFVTVVEKTTKTAWGGATRKDVRVAWKKAYESSPLKQEIH